MCTYGTVCPGRVSPWPSVSGRVIKKGTRCEGGRDRGMQARREGRARETVGRKERARERVRDRNGRTDGGTSGRTDATDEGTDRETYRWSEAEME